MQTLMVLRDHDGPLSELNHLMTTYPQLLKNVKVYSKNGWEENEQIRAAIAAAKTNWEMTGVSSSVRQARNLSSASWEKAVIKTVWNG